MKLDHWDKFRSQVKTQSFLMLERQNLNHINNKYKTKTIINLNLGSYLIAPLELLSGFIGRGELTSLISETEIRGDLNNEAFIIEEQRK